MTSPGGSFGDAAAEMANETEVEAPAEQVQQGASAPADPGAEGEPEDAAEPRHRADTPLDEGGEETGDLDADEPARPAPQHRDAHAETQEPSVEEQLAERTHDLQRLQAEYANYRKRVDRDRQLVAENAAYQALVPVVEVLDTIDRAREHGELDEGFQAVADQLERAVGRSGLTRFGEPGEAFDPTLHEALSHIGPEEGLEVTTVKVVAKAGYRIGDRVVRAAQVLVADPA